MLTVLHIITDLAPAGAQTMLLKLLTGVRTQPMRNMVVAMTGEPGLAQNISSLGVPVAFLGMRRSRPSLRALLRLTRLIRRFRPDVIQTWLYHADLMGLTARWLSRQPAALAWNIRCAYMDLDRYPHTTAWTVRALARLSSLPEVVITNSEAGRAVHTTLGYKPKRWEIIPNGFDLDRFRPDPGAGQRLRRELDIPMESLLIGYMARLDPMKDHSSFFHSASLLLRLRPEAHFILAGQGMASANHDLAAMVRKGGLEGRVHLLGERRDMPFLTAALDIAVSAAYGEGFPNIIGEAMACGVAAVATEVGDSATILGPCGKIVPPRDPEAMAEALASLAEAGPDRRAAIGAAGRERVATHYSIEAIAARYFEVYQEISRSCAA